MSKFYTTRQSHVIQAKYADYRHLKLVYASLLPFYIFLFNMLFYMEGLISLRDFFFIDILFKKKVFIYPFTDYLRPVLRLNNYRLILPLKVASGSCEVGNLIS